MAIKTKRFISSYKSCSCSMPGVWRAVSYCHGMVVIFHSPRACAHIAKTMDINAQYSFFSPNTKDLENTIPLLSSQLEEKHSIFGGVERLQECINFALEKYHPKCLVIASSCVAGVIGDDVNAVAKMTEEIHHLPVLTVDCCGFLDGEYYEGYFSITEKIVERFLHPCEKVPDTVLLLGDNGGPWGHYAVEVTRLLNKIGVKVIGHFPGYMSFNDLPKAASASAIIVLGGKGKTYEGLNLIAEKMSTRLDIPFLKIYPVGLKNTSQWLLAVGNLLHKEKEAQKVLAQEEKSFQELLATFCQTTENKKVVLCIGRLLMYYHPAAVLTTIKHLKMNLIGIVLLDMYDDEDRADMIQAIKMYTDISILAAKDSDDILKNADIVLTTHELQNRQIKQIFLPMLPKVGFSGELDFMNIIYRTLHSKIKGGVYYV